MTRLARYVLLSACLLGAARPARGDVAADARRDVARYIKESLASEEPKPSPFLTGITGYRITKVTVDESKAHVTVAFRIVYSAEICQQYYRPARWHSIPFDIDRSALGSPERVGREVNIHILGRLRVAQIERATLYYVIAGCFRSEANAKRYREQASRKLGEYGLNILRSSDYAGLRPGYFIVVQECGSPWQSEDPAEARRLAAFYRSRGIECYMKRIPPLLG